MTKHPFNPPQGALELYDKYAHGFISRRTFFDRLAGFAVGGLTVAALANAILPNYALAEQVSPTDARIEGEDITFPAPKGSGTMGGYLVRPAGAAGKLPGVVVYHENRGLNPYIRDVARRVALAGYVALAPDALYPVGGYPGNDDEGLALMRERDRAVMTEDLAAAIPFLMGAEFCNGNVGCVGFCFGGSIVNRMAATFPDLRAAVPFYSTGVPAEEVPNIKAPLLIHLAGLDERVNAAWPAYKEALQANDKYFVMHMYGNVNHGFHNDTTPRYNEDAAETAWARTITFFDKFLKG